MVLYKVLQIYHSFLGKVRLDLGSYSKGMDVRIAELLSQNKKTASFLRGDRFKNNVVDANESKLNTPTSPISSSAATQIRTNYVTMIQDDYARFGLDDNAVINENFIEYNEGVIENMYKLMQGENSFETDQNGDPVNSIESSIGFLPFNLKLDIDGIGGIKIYNRVKVNTEFLPSNYPDTLEFIITGVNHKLSDNDWVTSLETTATSKNFLDTKKKTK